MLLLLLGTAEAAEEPEYEVDVCYDDVHIGSVENDVTAFLISYLGISLLLGQRKHPDAA